MLTACLATSYDQIKDVNAPISSLYVDHRQITVQLKTRTVVLADEIGRTEDNVRTLYTEAAGTVPLAVTVSGGFKTGDGYQTM